MFRFLLTQPIDSMTTMVDLYPEGCELLTKKKKKKYKKKRIYLVIVQPTSGTAGRDERSKFIEIDEMRYFNSLYL